MTENIKDLQKWAKATITAKELELEAAMRFIIRNQPYDVFFDNNDLKNSLKGRQGMMYIQEEDGMPVLFVNWDECFPFDNQEELFNRIFEGDFSSNKVVKITGVKL